MFLFVYLFFAFNFFIFEDDFSNHFVYKTRGKLSFFTFTFYFLVCIFKNAMQIFGKNLIHFMLFFLFTLS
jgi:hypothetical protein